ncbi:MAG TPA: hypothetical protein VFR07_17730 [Mycobacteriales bacterium]|nr:hypothetical protein [Mycobacteriales bacterium]
MSSPGVADDDEDRQSSEDRQVSQSLFFASLTAGALGLFVGLILLFGPRGVVLSLGIVAIVLASISYRRAVADSERSGAVGSFLLGVGTSVVGFLVVVH